MWYLSGDTGLNSNRTAEGASFQPVDVPTGPQNIMLGDESLIKGLSEALVGLKVGQLASQAV